MAGYAVPFTRTADTTLAVGNVVADATRPRRGKLYDLVVGSPATPADSAFLLSVQRCTTAGTATSVTPRPLDPADAATEMDAAQNHTVNPTITANSSLLTIAFNQRATMRWVAREGKELVFPATASNGLVFLTPTAPAAVIDLTAHIEEQ